MRVNIFGRKAFETRIEARTSSRSSASSFALAKLPRDALIEEHAKLLFLQLLGQLGLLLGLLGLGRIYSTYALLDTMYSTIDKLLYFL